MATGTCERSQWLVIGGGFLGASTAIKLRELFPEEKVVWVLGTKNKIASSDINKIVRTTYADDRFKQLAEDAIARWKSDPILSECFHQNGWIQTMSEGSYRSTKKTSRDTRMFVPEFQAKIGTKAPPTLDENEELWYNPEVGSVDGARALETLVQRARGLGILILAKDVQRILVGAGDICSGVELTDGQEFVADKTILSAGVWSPGLLKRSNIPYRNDFFTVVGVVVASLPLSLTECDKMCDMPILVTEFGEVMVSKLHRVLKVTTTKTFVLYEPEEVNGDFGALEIGPHQDVLSKMIPDFAERHLDTWVCMDLMTKDQRPLIDRAESTQNLWLATAGNYHSAKFINFGDLVAWKITRCSDLEAASGLLDDVLLGCQWDRLSEVQPLHPGVVPKSGG